MDPTRPDDFDLADAVAILERTPAALDALLAGLPARWLHATEGSGSWSPQQVVAHLIAGERTNWLPRARHILAGDARPFPPFDRTPAGDEAPSVNDLLATFGALRRESLIALDGMALTPDDLERTGQHPEFGTVRLAQLLATWAVHDLDHLAQIARTIAKASRGAVGPWSAYLSILHDRE